MVTDQYYLQILLHIGPDFQLTPDMWAIVKKMVVLGCGLYKVTKCRMHLVDWQTCRLRDSWTWRKGKSCVTIRTRSVGLETRCPHDGRSYCPAHCVNWMLHYLFFSVALHEETKNKLWKYYHLNDKTHTRYMNSKTAILQKANLIPSIWTIKVPTFLKKIQRDDTLYSTLLFPVSRSICFGRNRRPSSGARLNCIHSIWGSDSSTTTAGHTPFVNPRCCEYSLIELLMMGVGYARNM
jgi:hypothetical protein